MAVNTGRLATRFVVALAIWFLLLASGEAQTKYIRLRNEVIPTAPPPRNTPQDRAHGDERAASGLFLIQFNEPPQTAWTEQLRGLGIELLRYVPEDTFV